MRSAIAVFITSSIIHACTFCNPLQYEPLRARLDESKIVVAGTLRNAKPNRDGIGGTTDLLIAKTIKGETSTTVITLPWYVPIIGQTNPDYVAFLDVKEGKAEPISGVPSSPPLTEYISALAIRPSNERLKASISYLEHKDEGIARDAFAELARATDADIGTVKTAFDRTKLRTWLADINTPVDRIGVYALMLGLCGSKDDADWFAIELSATPRAPPMQSQLGGLLAGLTLLDPTRGWATTQAELTNPKATVTAKLQAYQAVRYFQASRPKENRNQILLACKAMMNDSNVSDMAIEDLRRWEWWDLTKEAFEHYNTPGFDSKFGKRGMIRYALCCPRPEAKAFVEKAKSSDPTLVKQVEDGLELSKLPLKPDSPK